MAGPRYTDPLPVVAACEDCGAAVTDTAAHTRFHSILSAQAWALAVLQNTHLAPAVHNRYDAVDRIKSKRFDSWTNDALAEVAAEDTATRGNRQEEER